MKVKVKIKKDELRKKLDIKDGITPIKGKDYFDGKDGKDADEKKIVQKVLVKVPKPKDGKDGKDGKNGIAIDGKDGIDGIDGIGIDGKDGSPDTPPEIRNKLSSLKVPIMIISAEQDTLTPMKDQEYLYNHIDNAYWIKLPDVGHASMYENPLIFTSLVTGFFLIKNTKYVI